MVASSLANRSPNEQIDVTHIIQSVRSHVLEVAEQKRAADWKKQEQKRKAAAQREAARTKAQHEQQERTRIAEIERKEARARRLMDEIRRETPIEDLHAALNQLQGLFNAR